MTATRKHLIGALSNEWWAKAQSAQKWKPKYECMKEVFEILTGNDDINVEIKDDIADHKKSDDFLKILVKWMAEENHVFTRIAIFRLMPKLIEAVPTETLNKYVPVMLKTILTKQWREQKAGLLQLINPTLIRLWIKTKFPLDSEGFKPHFLAALKHRGKVAPFCAVDFLSKATMIPAPPSTILQQLIALCSDHEVASHLANVARVGKDKSIRIAGCKAIYGLDRLKILDKPKEYLKHYKEASIEYRREYMEQCGEYSWIFNLITKFDICTFVTAAEYGFTALIRHLMQMDDYPVGDDAVVTTKYKIPIAEQHLRQQSQMSAMARAIRNKHFDVVELLLDKHPIEHKEEEQEQKSMEYGSPSELANSLELCQETDLYESQDGRTRFYSPSAFDKLCNRSNIKLLKLLFVRYRWPVYHPKSQGLYEVVTSGNLPVLKVLLDHLGDRGEAKYVNFPLFQGIGYHYHRTPTPQINLNLLNAAINHHHLHIVKYLISEWKYRDVIIKNRCIFQENGPHTLPTLLHALLKDRPDIKLLEFLITFCDPMDLGLNWVCTKALCEQKFLRHRPQQYGQYYKERVLCINDSLCIGSNVAALIWKCQSLWTSTHWRNKQRLDDVKACIRQLITMMVLNGLDWYIDGDCDGVRNVVLELNYSGWQLTDYSVDICENQQFVLFFRETVQEAVGKWRTEVHREFEQFYKEDQAMIDIFRWHVLDFLVPREHVLDGFVYFTALRTQATSTVSIDIVRIFQK